MLYVATVHYMSPRWIEIQASYLRRHISIPFQTWGSIEGIDTSHSASFDRVLEQRGPHPGKLNHLALEICSVASDDDLIMFLDGDAFPIADPMPVIEEGLENAPLVAVRRAENLDEPQPHPSFCVTTVGSWRSLPGDWSIGPVWPAVNGKPTSDVGANLLRTLELSKTPWVQLLRTNGSHLHPLFFGIYGDIVYHHGAGFRDNPVSRVDRERLNAQPPPRQLLRHAIKRVLGRSKAGVRGRAEIVERNNRQSRLVFEAIQSDDPSWLAQVKDGGALSKAPDLGHFGQDASS
jgi:hypothetical protein